MSDIDTLSLPSMPKSWGEEVSPSLRVRADLDTESYLTKVKVKDEDLASVDLHPHHFHGEWNDTTKHQTATV